MTEETGLFRHPSADPASRPQSDVELGHFNRNPPELSLLALLREDYDTHERDPFSPGFWAVALHRIGNWRMGVRFGLLRKILSLFFILATAWFQWSTGIELAYTVKLGRRVRIWHHGSMVLGALEIGDDVHIRQHVTMGVRRHGDGRWMKPVIGSGCHLNAGAVIVGPIVVGPGSVIGANVVLAQDVAPNSIVTVPKPTIRVRRGG